MHSHSRYPTHSCIFNGPLLVALPSSSRLSVSVAEGTPVFEFVYRASKGKISEVVFDIQQPEDALTQTTTSWDFRNDLARCGDGFLAFAHFSDIIAVGSRPCRSKSHVSAWALPVCSNWEFGATSGVSKRKVATERGGDNTQTSSLVAF